SMHYFMGFYRAHARADMFQDYYTKLGAPELKFADKTTENKFSAREEAMWKRDEKNPNLSSRGDFFKEVDDKIYLARSDKKTRLSDKDHVIAYAQGLETVIQRESLRQEFADEVRKSREYK